MTPFHSDPQVQQQIATLITLLRNMPTNAVLSYADIWQAVGRKSVYVLNRARDEVEKADGVRFATVRTQGVTKLPADQVAAIGVQGVRQMHKKAKRITKRLSDLKGYNSLSAEDRMKIAGARMVASHVAEKTARNAIRDAVETIRTVGTEVIGTTA